MDKEKIVKVSPLQQLLINSMGITSKSSKDEIGKKLDELCGSCKHGTCHDESGYCLSYERRQYLKERLK